MRCAVSTQRDARSDAGFGENTVITITARRLASTGILRNEAMGAAE
jgi:hypothetical protein